jgi:hypothetical protein
MSVQLANSEEQAMADLVCGRCKIPTAGSCFECARCGNLQTLLTAPKTDEKYEYEGPARFLEMLSLSGNAFSSEQPQCLSRTTKKILGRVYVRQLTPTEEEIAELLAEYRLGAAHETHEISDRRFDSMLRRRRLVSSVLISLGFPKQAARLVTNCDRECSVSWLLQS